VEDAADGDAIRKHVEVVVVPVAGRAAGRCAFEDELVHRSGCAVRRITVSVGVLGLNGRCSTLWNPKEDGETYAACVLARAPGFPFESNAPHLQTTFAARLVFDDDRNVEIYDSELPGSAARHKQALFRVGIHLRSYGAAAFLLLGGSNAGQNFGERLFDKLS
jgi:hypothetical protein